MSFLEELYRNKIEENRKNLHFWEDYLQKLGDLNFSTYADKLTVPVLVPIGSRIFFRGELKHTNEVTISLGADYFVKCSINQAEILKQHRIKDAKSKLDLYKKELNYLENQFNFTKQNVAVNEGQEIIEYYTEEEDNAWRIKHRENVRVSKQKQRKEENVSYLSDEQLWERLEELELQEELENEYYETNTEYHSYSKSQSIVTKDDVSTIQLQGQYSPTNVIDIYQKGNTTKTVKDHQNKQAKEEVLTDTHNSKSNLINDVLQQVIKRQNELDNKLSEIKNREKWQSKTEEDLLSKLDEIEQLDELEDELDRLDDVLQTEDMIEKDEEISSLKNQKKVLFADENDSESLEITFTHSCIEPNKSLYDPGKGIQKPSDIYEAFSHNFNEKTTSILRNTKYEESNPEQRKINIEKIMTEKNLQRKTIIVNDVIEKENESSKDLLQNGGRPISLFKQKRLQNRS